MYQLMSADGNNARNILRFFLAHGFNCDNLLLILGLKSKFLVVLKTKNFVEFACKISKTVPYLEGGNNVNFSV